jgi:hypothetical protein
MELWEEDKFGMRRFKYNQEIAFCQQNYKHSAWLVPDKSVVEFFRCDLGDRWGDYAISIFRNSENIGGQSFPSLTT